MATSWSKTGRNQVIVSQIPYKRGFRQIQLSATETERAFMAALICGEGCISLYKNNHARARLGYHIVPVLDISNTDRGIIDWVLKAFPEISWAKEVERNKRGNRQRCIGLRLYRMNDMLSLLRGVSPYLVGKKATVAMFLTSFLRRRLQVKHNAPYSKEDIDLLAEFRRLNMRGRFNGE